MSIGEFCNRDVIVTGCDTSILDAAQLMRQYHVGDLLITAEQPGALTPIGIITDRDIVVKLVAKGLDPSSLTVGDIMGQDLYTADVDDNLIDTVKSMRSKGVRRIPVIDHRQQLVGIFSLDDAIDIIAEQLQDLAGLIHQEQRHEQHLRPN